MQLIDRIQFARMVGRADRLIRQRNACEKNPFEIYRRERVAAKLYNIGSVIVVLAFLFFLFLFNR